MHKFVASDGEIRPWGISARGVRNIGERVLGKVGPHVFSGQVPDRQQYAMPFVVAGPILMGLAKIAKGDRSVDRRDNFGEPDILRGTGQHVSASDTALGLDESCSLEGKQDLLKIGLGERGSRRNVAYRSRAGLFAMERERQQSATGVIASSGYTHAPSVDRTMDWPAK